MHFAVGRVNAVELETLHAVEKIFRHFVLEVGLGGGRRQHVSCRGASYHASIPANKNLCKRINWRINGHYHLSLWVSASV